MEKGAWLKSMERRPVRQNMNVIPMCMLRSMTEAGGGKAKPYVDRQESIGPSNVNIVVE